MNEVQTGYSASAGLLAPINDIPTEILSDILVIHAAGAFEEWTAQRIPRALLPDNLYGANFYEFGEVTRVCKRWRAIALECPAFWSSIVVGPYHNTQRLLERSQSHPLDVFCMLSDRQGAHRRDESFRLVLEHLHRFRYLQLCLRRRDKGSDLLYTAVTVPYLQDLIVHFPENISSGAISNYTRGVGANWIAPRLRRYKVWGGWDGKLSLSIWPVLQFKDTLTHLVWFPAKLSNTFLPSAEVILSTIRSLPNLETLHIMFSAQYPGDPFVPLSRRLSFEPVHLSRLRRLVLKGNVDTCVDILEHLTYPEALQQFGILSRSTSSWQPRSECIRVSDFLASLVDSQKNAPDSALSTKAIRTLGIWPNTLQRVNTDIQGWRSLESPLHFPSVTSLHDELSRPPFEDLDLCLSLPDVLPRVYLERILHGLRFDAVQTLQLGVMVHVKARYSKLPDEWLGVAAKMADVSTLAIGDAKVDYADLSRCLFAVVNDAGVRRCPYKKLRRLHVIGYGRWQQKAQMNANSTALQAENSSDDLEDLLSACIIPLKAQGIPVEQLTLTRCNETLGKAPLVRLRNTLAAEVLCDDVDGMTEQGSLLYSIPDTVDGEWMPVDDAI